ncbi:MAG TPA: hypothetical protein VER11_25830 [Polyangiaceae bacterium]|nr:hypothetical protein [Polyangiaceae bacterium]
MSNGAPPEAARASFEQLLFDPQSVFGKGAQEVRHLEWVHVVNDVGERNQPHQSPAVVDHQDPSALALQHRLFRAFDRAVAAATERILAHDRAQESATHVQGFGGHAQREIAIGHDTEGVAIDIDYRQEADAMISHQSRGVLHARIDSRSVDVALHDFAAQHARSKSNSRTTAIQARSGQDQ